MEPIEQSLNLQVQRWRLCGLCILLLKVKKTSKIIIQFCLKADSFKDRMNSLAG
jgi:hypothetical protein